MRRDFLSAREGGTSSSTQIDQLVTSLGDVAEVLNRSHPERRTGRCRSYDQCNITGGDPKAGQRLCLTFGAGGTVDRDRCDRLVCCQRTGGDSRSWQPFYDSFWPALLVVGVLYVGFILWKNSYVMIPDGSQALITRFGKLEATVGPGRTWLLNPWKRVSYIVNTTKEYPYNAPIRLAPTSNRVNASVDLFLQFRIEDPSEFIFTLGGAKGFSEKLQNAVSEVTRALIYEQRAENIYDLIGESTQSLLATLNKQFLPAVRLVHANITHAEPSDQGYRMDLAAAEIVRVAKEAYTYQYELDLRKEQDEGELNKELASSARNTFCDPSRDGQIPSANRYGSRKGSQPCQCLCASLADRGRERSRCQCGPVGSPGA